MSKSAEQANTGDIPSWFMTYSDVITLLMTFFILLLTFSTTEPERFEKATISFFGESGAKGVAGHPHEKLDRDSWSERVRPRAARIAMQGAEMPPMSAVYNRSAIGQGLRTVDDSSKDIMRTYSFGMPLNELISPSQQLTQLGMEVTGQLAQQLRSLPVNCTIEVGSLNESTRATALADNLYHQHHTRVGQTGVGIAEDVQSGWVRIVLERFD